MSLSLNNSTIVPLVSNGIFIGQSYDNILDFAEINIAIKCDTGYDLTFIYSQDKLTVDYEVIQSVSAKLETQFYRIPVNDRYFRLKIEATDGNMSVLNVQTIYKSNITYGVAGFQNGVIIESPLNEDGSVFVGGNLALTGSVDANITNTSLDVNITNPVTSVDANITNTSLDVNVTNPVTSVDANITNASLDVNVTNPVTSVDANITNTSLDVNVTNPVTSVDANITNANLDVTISNFPTTQDVNITNASLDVNVTNSVTSVDVNNFPTTQDVNITNASLDVNDTDTHTKLDSIQTQLEKSNKGTSTLWSNNVTGVNGVSLTLNLSNVNQSNLTIFGSVDGATNLIVQFSNDGTNFYDSQYSYVQSASGNWGFNITACPLYLRLKSTSSVTAYAFVNYS